MAERRLVLFCATCSTQPRRRQPATKSAVSYPLSAPIVLRGLALSSIISSAVVRSAVPVASVSRASTMSPLRFSVIRGPMWQSLASLPWPLRKRRASGSVFEKCVSFVRFSPWKSQSRFRPLSPFLPSGFVVLWHEAFYASPCFDQRPVDGEVLARQQRPD